MKSLIKGIILSAVLVLVDRMTKLWAIRTLKNNNPIVLLDSIFELRYLENHGAAFGMMQNQQVIFFVITVIVLAGIVFVALRIPKEGKFLPMKICLVFLAAGAIGNMIDRVTVQYVVDFIYFRLINFPIFNVADIYVTCSVFVLVLLIFFYYRDEDLDRIWKKN